jgi:hypothetical protein
MKTMLMRTIVGTGSVARAVTALNQKEKQTKRTVSKPLCMMSGFVSGAQKPTQKTHICKKNFLKTFMHDVRIRIRGAKTNTEDTYLHRL